MKSLLMFSGSAVLLSVAFLIATAGFTILEAKDNPPIYFNTIAASCDQE